MHETDHVLVKEKMETSTTEQPFYWHKNLTNDLLELREKCDYFFVPNKRGVSSNGWQELGRQLSAKHNVFLTGKRCKKKWENMVTRFRIIKKAEQESGVVEKSWPYYDKFETMDISALNRLEIAPPKVKERKILPRPVPNPVIKVIKVKSLNSMTSPVNDSIVTAAKINLQTQIQKPPEPTMHFKVKKEDNDNAYVTEEDFRRKYLIHLNRMEEYKRKSLKQKEQMISLLTRVLDKLENNQQKS